MPKGKAGEFIKIGGGAMLKGAQYLNSKPTEIMLRVTHTSPEEKTGAETMRTYDLPARVSVEKGTVMLKNTHFFKRDRPKKIAHLGYLLALTKFLIFYTCVARAPHTIPTQLAHTFLTERA